MAGVMLLATGVVYNVIGIRKRWFHIFLSSAYLGALAVAVLIVYVMTLPVNDAVQGAYLVAVTVTGFILGGISLIFTDVTEGLGCLLGGYCVSMWFLVLKPGGLITSTGGKAAFITTCIVVAFALSFIPFTRVHALMYASAFSGATVLILGIDCFARAGFKEFWLYIWGLNTNLFPLNTTTYPHTRGIQVEIAAIILLAICGVISQEKLWRVVKKRQEEKAAIRDEQSRRHDEAEEAVGRRVEQDLSRERVRWEGIYGDGGSPPLKPDSGFGEDVESLRKGSGSVGETRDTGKGGGTMEMTDLGPSQHSSDAEKDATVLAPVQQNIVTVRVAPEEDDMDSISPAAAPGLSSPPPAHSPATPRAGVSFQFTDNHQRRHSTVASDAARTSIAVPPAIVPLPFRIPETMDKDEDDHRSSVATITESVRNSRRRSKRFSASSALKRLSGGTSRRSQAMSEDEESLVIPHEDYDRASSIAATVDDLTNDQASLAPSRFGLRSDEDEDGTAKEDGSGSGKSGDADRTASADEHSTAEDVEGPRQAKGASSDVMTASSNSVNAGIPRSIVAGRSVKSVAPSEVSLPLSLGDLKAQMPTRMSKTVMVFRTNEWAKHLGVADEPAVEEINDTFSQEGSKMEVPAPVDVEDLQRTADSAPAPLLPRRVSEAPASYDRPQLSRFSSVNTSRTSVVASGPVSLPHSPSGTTLQRQSVLQRSASQSSLAAGSAHGMTPMHSSTSLPLPHAAVLPHGFRSSSSPVVHGPLIESAVEERPTQGYLRRQLPVPNPSETLIAKRDTLIRSKYSSMFIPAPSPVPELTPSDSASIFSAQTSRLDEEDMTLSERRTLIQQVQLQQARRSPAVVVGAKEGFDAHMPKRDSTMDPMRRESMLAQFRQSISEDLGASQQPQAAIESRRMSMINDHRQRRMSQQQAVMASKMRNDVFDERMRRGEMLDLHKESMRKMQANANKRASQFGVNLG
ncbi:MAG: hypothetical protein M1838_006244 [Thelocarpon superellum]|nr:MAG: hypothetical protein M1838_006244 [Thelocarpon superellum]